MNGADKLPDNVIKEIIATAEIIKLQTGVEIDVIAYLLETQEGIKQDQLPAKILGNYLRIKKDQAKALEHYRVIIRSIGKQYRRWQQTGK